MKKRITLVILLVTILTVFLACNVQAHNVEIDPNSYIYMPTSISYDGKGTISISSAVGSSYTLYYQKIDISDSEYDKILEKNKERKNYINSENEKFTIEEAEIESAKKIYEETKTQETLDNYKKAIDTYNNHVDEYNKKIKEYDTLINSLIPTYQENNWTTAVGTSNNVNLDFSGYSGRMNFVLWAKLVTSNGTYYDVNCYSTNLTSDISISLDKTTATMQIGETLKLNATTNSKNNITWKSSKENLATVDSNGNVKALEEGITVITATVDNKSASCTVTVTKEENKTNNSESDFSNAKFSYNLESLKYLEITISDYSKKENSRYYMYISKNKNENITSIPENAAIIVIDNEGIGKAIFNGEEASKILEYTGTNYIYIIEKNMNDNTQTVILKAKEMPTIALPSLGLRLDMLLAEPTNTKVYNIVQMNDNRKITYKIGKITSNDILRSFKKDSSSVAYSKLLDYAKNANYMSTGTITTNGLDYNIVNKLNIEKGAYYFVYMVVDNENGKYIDIEDVAIYTESNVKEGNALIHFDFADIEVEEEEDNTVVPDAKLPQTGVSYIIMIAIGIVVVVGIIAYKKYKKYIDIK